MPLSREEVIKKIEAASAFEEKSIPIYSNHLAASLDRSGFDEDVRKELSESLAKLARESQGHVELLKLVKKHYLEEN